MDTWTCLNPSELPGKLPPGKKMHLDILKLRILDRLMKNDPVWVRLCEEYVEEFGS